MSRYTTSDRDDKFKNSPNPLILTKTLAQGNHKTVQCLGHACFMLVSLYCTSEHFAYQLAFGRKSSVTGYLSLIVIIDESKTPKLTSRPSPTYLCFELFLFEDLQMHKRYVYRWLYRNIICVPEPKLRNISILFFKTTACSFLVFWDVTHES